MGAQQVVQALIFLRFRGRLHRRQAEQNHPAPLRPPRSGEHVVHPLAVEFRPTVREGLDVRLALPDRFQILHSQRQHDGVRLSGIDGARQAIHPVHRRRLEAAGVSRDGHDGRAGALAHVEIGEALGHLPAVPVADHQNESARRLAPALHGLGRAHIDGALRIGWGRRSGLTDGRRLHRLGRRTEGDSEESRLLGLGRRTPVRRAARGRRHAGRRTRREEPVEELCGGRLRRKAGSCGDEQATQQKPRPAQAPDGVR